MDLDGEFTPPNSVMYIASGDSMNCQSTSSAPSKGRLTADLPENKLNAEPARFPTPKTTFVSGPCLSPSYFDLEMGHGSIARDPRTRSNHLFNVFQHLMPIMETPLSAPIDDKYRIIRHSVRKCADVAYPIT